MRPSLGLERIQIPKKICYEANVYKTSSFDFKDSGDDPQGEDIGVYMPTANSAASPNNYLKCVALANKIFAICTENGF